MELGRRRKIAAVSCSIDAGRDNKRENIAIPGEITDVDVVFPSLVEMGSRVVGAMAPSDRYQNIYVTAKLLFELSDLGNYFIDERIFVLEMTGYCMFPHFPQNKGNVTYERWERCSELLEECEIISS